MGIRLLDKTRKVNKLIHNYDSNKLNFCDISCVLGDVLDSEILVISRSGKILGASKNNSAIKLSPLLAEKKGEKIDPQLNERLLTILSTKENVNLMTLGFENVSGDYSVIIAPINIAGNRLGTLFVFR
ncbi:MAG: GTP-sensing pleiotropic transcriptional regulator CodY, partial [Lachnospiraceae bacterium]|nr:GTP-sensing pleiotropic transcriptional regulator CodY [Lachnospiraceae bacterium]